MSVNNIQYPRRKKREEFVTQCY